MLSNNSLTPVPMESRLPMILHSLASPLSGVTHSLLFLYSKLILLFDLSINIFTLSPFFPINLDTKFSGTHKYTCSYSLTVSKDRDLDLPALLSVYLFFSNCL
mmetsp:Transcript_32773/g.5965  ORF Transcript_32773/g.5965 Transcript_32773/m.5965 type:complete len:103 (+) Transcript_32773:54-362(+)